MPDLDGTGPMGNGPMTGRRMGKCFQNEPGRADFFGRSFRRKGGCAGGWRNPGVQQRFRRGQ